MSWTAVCGLAWQNVIAAYSPSFCVDLNPEWGHIIYVAVHNLREVFRTIGGYLKVVADRLLLVPCP